MKRLSVDCTTLRALALTTPPTALESLDAGLTRTEGVRRARLDSNARLNRRVLSAHIESVYKMSHPPSPCDRTSKMTRVQIRNHDSRVTTCQFGRSSNIVIVTYRHKTIVMFAVNYVFQLHTLALVFLLPLVRNV